MMMSLPRIRNRYSSLHPSSPKTKQILSNDPKGEQKVIRQNRKLAVVVIVILAILVTLNLARVVNFCIRALKPVKYLEALRSNQTEFYAIARVDRSGSAIHDMLMAHAFAFHHNVSYKGACFVVKDRRPRNEVILLQETFALDSFIPYACPPHEEMSYKLVEDRLYRRFDSCLFTTEWRKHVHSLVKLPKPETNHGSGGQPFRIAVNIRRGDVTPCKYPNRYLPNSHYIRLIDVYASRRSNLSQPLHVTIFSQSKSFEDFNVFLQRNFSLQLDSNLATVWSGMAIADVAILSRSSFSYVPAILNPNVVVYTPFWHKALEGWEVVKEDFMSLTLQDIKALKKQSCKRQDYFPLYRRIGRYIKDSWTSFENVKC